MSKKKQYGRWHKSDHPYLTRLRIRLEWLLGGYCGGCGKVSCMFEGGTTPLQFHHEGGREYSSRKLSWATRLYRYKKEIEEGKIKVLLCQDCHTDVTAHKVLIPF